MVKKEDKKENNKSQTNQTPHLSIYTPKTFGQRASDKLTKWAGSWTFIFSFFIVVIIWISVNAYFLINTGKEPFDPFPYILLNLALSLLAAIQAPIILMSQNRQSQKDRQRSEYDYATNRRAERGIQDIQKKLNKIEKRLSHKR